MENNYQSEITQFINKLKTERPHVELEQKKGRSILWDKFTSRELSKGFDLAKVKQKPYVYQPD